MGLLTDYYGQLGQLVAAPERKSISTLSMASPQDSQFARRAKDAIQNTTAYQNISHAINQPVQQVSDLYALLSGQGGQEEADRYVESIGQGLMGMGGAIKAYHGTPHTFKPEVGLPFGRFKKEAIGSGEGAAAYGHGASYSAENPEVAQGYFHALRQKHRTLTDNSVFEVKGQPIDVSHPDKMIYDRLASNGIENTLRDSANRLASARELLSADSPVMRAKENAHKRLINIASGLKDSDINRVVQVDEFIPQGHLLELSHQWPDPAREAADPLGKQHLLDWDKPLSEQSDSIKQALSSINAEKLYKLGIDSKNGVYSDAYKGNELSGEQLIKYLGNQHSPQAASEYLHSLGVPGIKYLDGSSRGAGQGSHNFVMFEPEYTNITARDGVTLEQALRDVLK